MLNDDISEKIHQSVEFGSVFLALENNLFTHNSLLAWLAIRPITTNTRIAYRAVCDHISPNDQYLEDSYHILTKHPDYADIAMAYGLVSEIPDQNPVEGDPNPIIAHLCDMIIKINMSLNVNRLTALILSGRGSKPYIKSQLVTCFKAHNFPHMRTMTAHDYNIGLVDADWTIKLRYNEQLPSLLLQRVTYLRETANLYYSQVVYKHYYQVAHKLNKDKLLTQLSRDNLIIFDSLFPNIIDHRLLQYNILGYKISLLSNDVAGYVLGFPIHNIIPNEDQIHQDIQVLIEQGV